LAQPSEAKIVYKPTHVHISSSYNLDLNHDGITDFTIQQGARSSHYCRGFRQFRGDWLTEAPMQGNATVVDPSNPPKPTALHRGAEVGPRQNFGASSGFMALVYSGYDVRKRCMHVRGMADDWVNVSNRYLGLKFIIRGKTHYGWARLSVQVGYVYINAILTGYAYETIPGKPIKAGQTKGAADDLANDPDLVDPDGPGLDASLTNPIPDIPQPASLGMLALGARGVPMWRRKESLGATQ